ncbi:hypothetical protein [Bradyrhizobium sp. CCGB20]|uniref:hypothetical protein n=1 Tax=Bradyrhizobium sp. CCGB20 TaxID=2949633 RepID=UPI0020B37BA6|nr:hypothetical protein [Bradyrhizobium sp. CCGB20]MCP3403444.1 hypothetical protein [Bradyrhizobium sp. CCGB20]
MTANSLLGQARLVADGAAQGVDAATAKLPAIAQPSGQIQRHALVMTYGDCFWLLGMTLLAIVPIVLLLRRPAPGLAVSGGH